MKPTLLLFGFLLMAVLLQAKTNNSPYGFIENKGQIIDQNNNLNPAVKYLWTGNDMKVQLKGNSFSYEVLKIEKFKSSNPQASTTLSHRGLEMSKHGKAAMDDSTVIYSHRIDIELLGANPNPELKPDGLSEDYLNYYTTGTPEAGVTYVHQYQKVTYQNIYPNIDLEFVLDATNKQPFKYNFIVRPGGRVSDIQLQYNGANSTQLTASGSLNITTAYGNLEESIPSSYVAETGKDIDVHYQQNREGVYGFSAGNYNAQQTLVIDPWITYLGGNYDDGIYAVNFDGNENIYCTGYTNSTNNIVTTGAYQTVLGGSRDVFIVKYDTTGQKLWGTYYGGTNQDMGSGLSIDKQNNVIITGTTQSNSNIATVGAHQTSLIGICNAFIAKFNNNGLMLWATYYGSAGTFGKDVTTDSSNNIYIIGETGGLTDIATPGAFQSVKAGTTAGDVFIVKFNSSGVRQWGTYYGGDDSEDGFGISTDKNNNIAITGLTQSTNNIATAGAFQTTLHGFGDAFIARFTSSGNRLWGTYFGDTAISSPNITTDTNCNIIASGVTSNNSIGFTTIGAYQSIFGGQEDFYIVKFDTLGNRLWCTYYGGSGSEMPGSADICTDKHNCIYITGVTESTNNIATNGAYQTNNAGDVDAVLAKFSETGQLLWGTYLGTIYSDGSNSVSVSKSQKIVIAGGTDADTGFVTVNAYQTIFGGSIDGFLACFDSTGHIPPTGINDLNQQTESLIIVYPNPAKDKITVSIKDDASSEGTILLTTIDGKVVKSVRQGFDASTPLSVRSLIGDKDFVIDVKDLSAGVYLLEYNNGEVCETVKFIKE